MKILLSPALGYCRGVLRSIAMATEALLQGLPVYTLGPLVHNAYTVRALAQQGIRAVDVNEAIALRDAVLVVRAHGVGQSTLAAMHPSVRIVDATCPSVAVLHRYARQAVRDGLGLIVIGDPDHPEVQGVVADGPADTVCICTEQQAHAYTPTRDAISVVQTTFDPDRYAYIVNIINNVQKMYGKTLANKNTICYTTKEREQHSIHLAAQSDAVMVVGDATSANTCTLVELCQRYCPRVYRVEGVQDIGKIKNQKISVLGVTTGASTPRELVTEVITRMSNEERANIGEEVEVAVDEAAEVSSATEEEVTPAPITSMEQAVANMVEVRPGVVVTCRVLEVRAEGLVVDCGQKKDGFIAAENCGLDEYNPDNFQKGQTFKAKFIENKSGDKSMLTLSKRAVDSEQLARDEREAAEREIAGKTFTVVVTKVVKGGLLATKGDYTIFIPASHVDVKHLEEEELQAYVGQTIVVKRLPPKKDEPERETRSKRIVASRKLVLIAERRAAAAERKKAHEERIAREEQEKKDIFEANKDRFEVNNIVPGTVKKFVSFGVFVNVYGFDCLCPTSEISWVRTADPTTVLEQGKEYEFLIIKVDPENLKVTLSYKQIQRQPYEVAAEKYPVGSIVHGVVQSIVKFGVFVSIEPGVDGLVHISNISREKVENPEDVLQVGQEVDAKVISFTENRIALSIKDVTDPEPRTSEGGAERPARQPSRRKFDRPQQERKPRKPEDNLMSEEEKQNMETYTGGEAATNNAFADMLAGFQGASDDGNNE